jgi:hypothetical protein
VAILLVSADFLASDFIAENELPPLLEKAERGGATILAVIASPCGFRREKKLADYQAVNDPSQPLDSLTRSKSEQVLTKLTEAVETALTGATGGNLAEASQEPATKAEQNKLPAFEGARSLLPLGQAEPSPETRVSTEIFDSIEPGGTPKQFPTPAAPPYREPVRGPEDTAATAKDLTPKEPDIRTKKKLPIVAALLAAIPIVLLFLAGFLKEPFRHRNETRAEYSQTEANQGDLSLTELGFAQQLGLHGTIKNLAKAVATFQKAADQGDSRAQCHLGELYERGEGVPKDLKKARELYQKAADQGNPRAVEDLAKLPAG